MKVGIVGTGFVGATAAYALVMRGVGREIMLVDKNARRAEAEADDIRHAVPFAHPLEVRSGDYSDLAGSRVVLLCAGVNQKPGETRLELLRRNAAIFAEIVPQVVKHTPEAVLVTTSYVKAGNNPSRPVFFLFNGGPGSGSVWLMMGAFGPKRVAIPSDARDDGAPPYPLLDNPDSLLDVADLVFIDPPGTGFSYLTEGTDPKKYYGLEADARAVAKVIRLWLNENGRWNSPKYLGGESYGTTRTAMGGVKRAADIMNFLDSSVEGQLMDSIREVDEDLSTQIEDLMFVFDNLADVDDRGIQALLREVSSDVLVLALKGSDDAIKEKVFKNMSKRAAELLRDDLEAKGPVRVSDVESAQKEILTIARRMAEAGEIVLGGKGGEEMI